jgi:endonuclease YncB( thermonuclease family)
VRLRLLLVALVVWGACDRPAPLPPQRVRPIPPGAPETRALEGPVVAIHDGDTLSLNAGGRRVRVRLAQIDAPERGQPWGRRSHQALARLAERRSARVSIVDRDRYGRAVGDLFVGDVFVNEALVREGHAWVIPRYARSEGVAAAEEEARRERRGLWRLPPAERVPPWEWRRAHPRQGGRTPPTPQPGK